MNDKKNRRIQRKAMGRIEEKLDALMAAAHVEYMGPTGTADQDPEDAEKDLLIEELEAKVEEQAKIIADAALAAEEGQKRITELETALSEAKTVPAGQEVQPDQAETETKSESVAKGNKSKPSAG